VFLGGAERVHSPKAAIRHDERARPVIFIMRMGQYYFVGFGEMGDACYGYSESNVPLPWGAAIWSIQAI
jgi:hypothetical protein